jgi:HSP20 family protein
MGTLHREPLDPATSRSWAAFRAMRELLRWDPLQESVPGLSRDDESLPAFVPVFEASESDEGRLLEAFVPCFRARDLHLEVKGDRLTLRGERAGDDTSDENEGAADWSFVRTFTLPDDVDTDAIRLTFDEGFLRLELPRLPNKE